MNFPITSLSFCKNIVHKYLTYVVIETNILQNYSFTKHLTTPSYDRFGHIILNEYF